MNREAWFRRLAEQLPGWHVWYTSPGMPGKWMAVPAPATASHIEAVYLPLDTRVSADTPTELRRLARERYGWDDYCESCIGTLARECGHRQPEREKALPR